MSVPRRRLLQLAGLTALGASLPRTALQAFMQTGEAPRRLIVVSHCHGWPYATWRLRPEGLAEHEPWSVDLASMSQEEFSQPLAPLYEHRQRMLALDGLSLATAELDAGGNRHDRGWVHAWTGNNANFSARDTRSTSTSALPVLSRSARAACPTAGIESADIAKATTKDTTRPFPNRRRAESFSLFNRFIINVLRKSCP